MGNAAHESAIACEAACFADPNCFQYSYTNTTCRYHRSVRVGEVVEDKDTEFISGWNIEKLKELGLQLDANMTTGCEQTTWPRPEDPWP
jgi:hypothetical protein